MIAVRTSLIASAGKASVHSAIATLDQILLRRTSATDVGLVVAAPGLGLRVVLGQAAHVADEVAVRWTSSGGCSDRDNSTCTSFDGLRRAGVEVGHAAGTYSHANGY